jgi:hypothetical protein
MLLEHFKCTFGGIDSVVVGWDEVDVHMVALDRRFNGRGWIPAGIEIGKYVRECCNHGTIGFGWHGADKDGIQVVDVCHKHILHVAEGSYRESTGAVGLHHPDV